MSGHRDRSMRRRWNVGRAYAEMHYQLRTEGKTPLRTGLAVGLGVLVGATPLYGLQLPLCAGLAKLFGLSRIRTYLAAHVNNPLTFPFLIYLEYGTGLLLREGRWPALSFEELRQAGLAGFGLTLLLGMLVVGVSAGLVLGVAAWLIARRQPPPSFARTLREEASRVYVAAGAFHWEYVRGKVRHDPVFLDLLHSGVLPDEGRLVDLGCGRGILFALILASRRLRNLGEWHPEWPAPPERLEMVGVDGRVRVIRAARRALGGGARLVRADLRTWPLPPARVFLLLDVLHYLAPEEQEDLLARCAAALEPGGRIVIREADRGAGLRFRITALAERIASLLRLDWRQRFAYRSGEEWAALLRGHGLEVTVRPMWGRTPFGNVLLEAARGASA